MAPKRKSDAIELNVEANVPSKPQFVDYEDPATGFKARILDLTGPPSAEPPAKKARVGDASKASSTTLKSKSKKENAAPDNKPQTWRDIKLDDKDEEGGVPVYDTCSEIRRKIRLLQKTPGWKVTHWLKEIGNVNNNSYNRFMKEKDKQGGAGNGTYYCAYVYFEKVRVLEGKKKTPTRKENEAMMPGGFALETPARHVWVFGR